MSRRRPQATILSRRLMAALRAAGADLQGDDDLYFIQRLYPGAGQRSGGAWAWSLGYPSYLENNIRAVAMNVGSQWPVTYLLKKGLTIDNNGIGYVAHPKT